MAWISRRAALDDVASRNFPQTSYGLSLSFPLTLVERETIKSAQNEKPRKSMCSITRRTVIQEVDFQIRLLRTTWGNDPDASSANGLREAALQAEHKSSRGEKHPASRAQNRFRSRAGALG